MNKYWIILILILIAILLSVLFIISSSIPLSFLFIKFKGVECGYWDEIGIQKKCICTGKLTTFGDIGAEYYCSGKCLQDCVCQAPYKTESGLSGIREIDCDELERLISEGYYGEVAKDYIK